MAQTLLGFTDTAFLGRVGQIELGAAAIAGLIYFALFMLGFGFGLGLQIIVARRNGEGKTTEIGKTVQHGSYFLLLIAVFAIVLVQSEGSDGLKFLLSSNDIFQASNDYLKIRIWGILFAFIHISLRAFFIGISKTRIISHTTLIMALCNVILDYLLIFGHAGFPQMGIKGAALASVLAEGMACIYFIIYTIKTTDKNKYRLFNYARFDSGLFKTVISTCFPAMLQNFISLSAWLIFFFLVEKLGELELAASNIIRNIYNILLLPIWGHSAAVNSLVSNLIGQGRERELFGLIKKAIINSTLMVFGFCSLILLLPEQSIMLISADEFLISMSKPLLWIISFGAVSLSVSFVFFSAVSGTGRTLEALIIETAVLIVYLLYAWFVCRLPEKSITLAWTSELVYSVILGLVSYIYLKSERWKGKQV